MPVTPRLCGPSPAQLRPCMPTELCSSTERQPCTTDEGGKPKPVWTSSAPFSLSWCLFHHPRLQLVAQSLCWELLRARCMEERNGRGLSGSFPLPFRQLNFSPQLCASKSNFPEPLSPLPSARAVWRTQADVVLLDCVRVSGAASCCRAGTLAALGRGRVIPSRARVLPQTLAQPLPIPLRAVAGCSAWLSCAGG